MIALVNIVCLLQGLFKQKIVDGWQTEMPDVWLPGGEVWLTPRSDRVLKVRFGGWISQREENGHLVTDYHDDTVIEAMPYDLLISGGGSKIVSTLRLWKARSVNTFDMKSFSQGDYTKAMEKNNDAEVITKVLYPSDDHTQGKTLRLKQQYFLVSASIQNIINDHMKRFKDIRTLPDKAAIHINDTHPTLCIPELMRFLLDECGYAWDRAWDIVKGTVAYTNHTIMAEALEKWPIELFSRLLPRIYQIVEEINRRFIMDIENKYANTDVNVQEKIRKMAIVYDGQVKMAHMAIVAGYSVNGVARLHTEILKNDALKEWYDLYPEKFQNKTNGITPRRWIALCNKELSALISELNKGDEWKTDLDQLQKLKWFADNKNELQRFMDIKRTKKVQLAEYIKEHEGIEINPDSIFDIQIKRLHEYKRQLLNAFGILYIYFGIKDGSIKDFHPMTFIFGAKSAPGYRRAKGIIKYINEIGKLVNNDPDTKDLLKVVFVQNYRVSYAEKLVTAADISEQISTAGTEASGTGNMKFMLNGTVTLGTLDGANVEIVEEAGKENNYIFGATVEDLEEIMKIYDPRYLVEENKKIGRVVRTLIDGTVSDGGTGVFRELYFSLMDGASWHRPDNYHLIGDLESYVEAKLKVNKDYKDKFGFAKKCWMNMACSGKFSSDRTIADYAKEIWKIEKVTL